ncbi:excalibur calcium-binding domain-containing protein [Asticcacaulis sp. ZE23SCel15]|uniref:excalibur calcium-binding domain-containing protein n=1 Tax=Asticcacaulis sp. ZE23SCel15 TaxID=3059027 RepID=UPI00349EC40F
MGRLHLLPYITASKLATAANNKTLGCGNCNSGKNFNRADLSCLKTTEGGSMERRGVFLGILVSLLSLAPIFADAKSRKKRRRTPSRRLSTSTSRSGSGGSSYYRNCSEARATGAAPIRRGEPGYGFQIVPLRWFGQDQ